MLFNWQDDWQGHHLYMTACDAAYPQLRRVWGRLIFLRTASRRSVSPSG
jgi:hypothetical protein